MASSLFELTGKVALVTGGNGGIGKAIASGFLDAGAKVAISARNDDKTDKAVSELSIKANEIKGYHVDVGEPDEVAEMVKSVLKDFGRIDILVNNAGVSPPMPVAVMPEKTWMQVINTNLTGTFRCSQAVGKSMISRREGGKIINIASEFSQFGGAMLAAYAASKGGIVQFTKSLAVEWATNNICVNALAPGWIETDMTASVVNSGFGHKILQRTPMGRWGEPNDMIGAAVFLASTASDFITGQTLVVDGGFNIMG